MKVAGFTFIRNAVKNDYPIVEAITSILPLCDEFIVAVGNSTDGTADLVRNIGSPKIKIIDTVWDDNQRVDGAVFAVETDKAFAQISADADWAFYIQGDECVHEKYIPVIKKAMVDNLDDKNVEGLLFKYLHFYGTFDYYAHSRRYYRREVRIVRNNPSVHSYRDAQGFRWNNRKLNVKLIDAFIYHYGWVKSSKGLISKGQNFTGFYNPDFVADEKAVTEQEFDYGNADNLVLFKGTHPAVMQSRVARSNWQLDLEMVNRNSHMDFRRRFLHAVEMLTGWRIGEYRNYRIIT
ncbi:glycosyltransferase family 2 protein [Mucilaginibacter hurinus]|uniref:Glycosyltransferase family 2 protein n=1 Tax=Mucilaginibacter hurinus TaxID=2201324 RepID=A0A367GPH9_9SPHI|nr:glycosyltransferase family 2 protein [Mucilaginibacter hurinus]RCH54561.1 glycosyltransferase family 2 protein [Mucilaginibacter hurinus]